ncbi:MAG: GntR family transcriptional regulator [Defluviitaleaceae bacterium]|nr:GntR family transcriptional regulator [Defluviitaleaceae bacterium]MCL2835654.1 GntR family transcriptional regulator [Defluviitaleaceae bacterium]
MSIEINTQNPMPIYEQLRNQIVLGIASGKLAPGTSLPPVRKLAADQGVNFHTVNKAYASLCDEGFIIMDRRKGAVVADIPSGVKGLPPEMIDKLNLISAEAICKGMDYMYFVNLCMQSYRFAKGE